VDESNDFELIVHYCIISCQIAACSDLFLFRHSYLSSESFFWVLESSFHLSPE